MIRRACAVLALVLSNRPCAIAQPTRLAPQTPPTAVAHRSTAPIHVDGRLDEADWALATPLGPFLQRDPLDGQPATEATEVRILYD